MSKYELIILVCTITSTLCTVVTTVVTLAC